MNNCKTFTLPKSPIDEQSEFEANLKEWSNKNNKDPRAFIKCIGAETTNLSSPVKIECSVDESFFDMFPKWENHVQK